MIKLKLDEGKEATKSENMSAGIDKTNDFGVPSGTIPEHTDMSLTTTAEVLVELVPLATAPASPKGKDKKRHPHTQLPLLSKMPLHLSNQRRKSPRRLALPPLKKHFLLLKVMLLQIP
ncbi:hypothetical protein COLO4_05145 [Corchorus olitorius]|uniref:Uncharacterized protein n=1 Tax=Corchorus olitorius TaxID=93759 RepID=A0A1R3KRT0_9ROSI|nr:hypothetical protein COLO4_05145 [Corchorus olitorius]